MSKPTRNRTTIPSLTPKQKKLLDFIQEFTAREGYSPSQREIARHFGFRSVGTVQRYKANLEKNGLIQSNSRARGLTVVPRERGGGNPAPQSVPTGVDLPVLGQVAAGRPIERMEHEKSLEVPVSLLPRGRQASDCFVLKVSGTSMIDYAVLDGDYVILRRATAADHGQIVVASVDGGATLKRFVRKKDAIELHPGNDAFPVLKVDPEADFRIEGILVGVIRRVMP